MTHNADEGYIKFKCLRRGPKLSKWHGVETMDAFIKTRKKLIEQQWLGQYQQGPLAGIGFGNLSVRAKIIESNKTTNTSSHFHITGSATGGLESVQLHHLPLIVNYQFDKNEVHFQGDTNASSETMSHAIIYETKRDVNAVLHIHDRQLWEKSLKIDGVCKTLASISYGTPEMAYAIKEAMIAKKENASIEKIILMVGHKEGLLAYGTSLGQAFKNLLRFKKSIIGV